MKKLAITCLILSGWFTQLGAQDLQDQLVDELCTCVTEEVSPDADAETVKMELGLCMLNITSGRSKEIEEEMGIDLSSPNGFREFGEQLGGVLALKCEKFVELLFQAKDGEASLADEAMEERKGEVNRKNTRSYEGKIEKLAGNDIMILRLSGGEEFYCIDEFTGFGLLRFKKDLIGKEVQLTYFSRKVFDKDSFEFVERKIVSTLEMK
ncbi:MAG: hypothetical protein R8P61_23100 [Bacteroidia bacterium]|nr:hypothetical protein [Bacteroidia bacterium]